MAPGRPHWVDGDEGGNVTDTNLGILNATILRSILPCDGISPPQHLLFNLANGCFLVSYLAPSKRRGLLFMHSLLIIGFLIYSTWAWNIICAPDVFAWNFSFMLLNMGQTLYILYQMKPVRIKRELEELYKELFEPLQVPRGSFKRLVSPEYAQTMSLHAGEAYALCNLTKTDRLGLLIEGKASVLSSTHYLHSISPMEFLDSPEFESSRTSVEDKFKVTVIAITNCRYIYWQRSSLEFFFVKDSYMSTVLAVLIARDITSKLYSMNHKIVTEKGSQLDIRLPSLTSSLSLSVGDNLSNKPNNKKNFKKSSVISLTSSLPMFENKSLLSLRGSPDVNRFQKGSRHKISTFSPPMHHLGFQKIQKGLSKGFRPLSAMRYPHAGSLPSPFESELTLNEEDEENRELLDNEQNNPEDVKEI